jgi:hypothetical protein
MCAEHDPGDGEVLQQQLPDPHVAIPHSALVEKEAEAKAEHAGENLASAWSLRGLTECDPKKCAVFALRCRAGRTGDL